AGGVRGGPRDRAVDRQRAPADRPARLCDRRQREGGGPQRHPGADLHHRSLRRLGPDRRVRRLRARRQAPHRAGQCRPRLSPAGAGRRLPRHDHDQARPRQRLGDDVRRHHPRSRHFRHPAIRRRLLRDPALQRRDPRRLDRARCLRAAPARGDQGGAHRTGDELSRAWPERTEGGDASVAEIKPERPACRARPARQSINGRERMLKSRILTGTLLASAAAFGFSVVAAQADDAADMQAAKDYIAKASAPVTEWTGPTSGPKAQGKKLIVYASADQRNGGASGVGDGAAEAAKAIGWDFRVLDGQGSVPGRTSALTQAIALKPDGIILGTIDAAEQAPMIEQAVAAGIKVVGWHSGAAPGKIDGVPGVFTNITPIRSKSPRLPASTRW